MTLGDLIKSYRQSHGLTMKQFSDLSGLSKAYISMLEKNRHPQNGKEIIPSIETFSKVAIAMKISLHEILEAVNSNQLIELNQDDPELPAPAAGTASLSASESELVDKFRQLNDDGQEKLLDYAEDLAGLPRYKKDNLFEALEEEA